MKRRVPDSPVRRRATLAIAGVLAGASTARLPHAIVFAGLLGGLGWRAGGIAAARAERERAAAIARALPDAIDLLAVCVIGGLGLEPALRRIRGATGGPLAEALGRAIAALDAGLRWDDALQIFADRARAPEAAAFVGALRRGVRYGTPLADTLTACAASARRAALDRMREHAMGAPVRMLFPLTLCFLPAFVLLAIAPSLLVAAGALAGR